MSQNSLVLPTTGTVSGLQQTQNMNNALDTLNTLASGASAPGSPEAGQLWHDTTNNVVKIRSLDGTTWISLFKLDETGYQALLSNSSYNQSGFINKFRNGTMDIWQRSTSGTITAGTPAYTADGWIVNSTGANIPWAQSTANIRTSTLSTYSLLLTGAASVTDILVKQRIESYIAQQLEGQQVTVQAQVYNNTGGSITPTITVKHATAVDNWGATTTDVNAVNLQACANGAWTKVAYTFPASSSSGNGLEITIDFGNNFSTSGKSVQITEMDIRVTPGLTTGLCASPPLPEMRHLQAELALCQRYFFSTFPPGTAPAQNAGQTGQFCAIQGYGASAGNQGSNSLIYPVQMRANPTVTTYSPLSASSQVYNVTRATQASAIASNGSSAGQFSFTYTTAAGSSAGDLNSIHITSSAEL